MNKINCLGDYCPIPLLKIKKALSELAPMESVMLVTDHSCVIESIKEHLSHTSFSYVIDEVINGVWEITVKNVNH